MKRLFFILASAALLFAACMPVPTAKEEMIDIQEEVVAGGVPFSFTASPTTKTVADGLSVKWAEGDRISLFSAPAGGTFAAQPPFAVTDTENGTFEGSVVLEEADSYDWAAVYPYKAENTSLDALKLTIGSARINAESGSTSELAGEKSPYYGVVKALPSGEALSFNMNQLAAGIYLELVNVTNFPKENVSKITVKFPEPVVGDFIIDVTGEEITYTATENTSDEIVFEFSEPVTFDKYGLDLYAAVKPFSVENALSQVTFAFNDEEPIKTGYYGYSVAPGHVKGFYYSQPKPAAVSLSAGGHYANCYVISKPGRYIVDVRKPDGTMFENCYPRITWFSSADEGWAPTSYAINYTNFKCAESNIGGTCLSKLIPQNSTQSFRGAFEFDAVMKSTGNVMLALYDDDLNIVWSCHLWFTKDPADITNNGIVFMDRDLGAGYRSDVAFGGTGIKPARGLYYQWGRKEPIIGPHGDGEDTQPLYPAEEMGTAMYYYYYSTTWGLTEGWRYSSEADLTAGDGASSGYPMVMVSEDKLPNQSATAWPENANPCPYGYRLPTPHEMDVLINDNIPSATFNGTSGQVKFGDVAFPFAGYREETSGKRVAGTDGVPCCSLWVDDTYNGDGRNYELLSRNTGSRYGGYMIDHVSRARACNIRCVKK